MLSKHILEIRVKPDALFLDKRGKIASQLSDEVIKNWKITNDRIDFHSDTDSFKAFFSYRNLGAASQSPTTTDQFLSFSKSFVKNAWIHFDYRTITRIGIWSHYLIEVEDFIGTFENYRKKFLKLSDHTLDSIGGDLIDLKIPLNFIDGLNHLNLATGPMEKSQSSTFFGEDAYDAGIYIEIDFFREEFSPNIKQREALAFIEEAIKKTKSAVKKINDLVLEEKVNDKRTANHK